MIDGMNASPDSSLCLSAQALNAASMAPYGWLLDIDAAFASQGGKSINAGTSRRADLPGILSLDAAGGRPMACVFRARGQSAQGPWVQLERHRLGSQTFVPMSPPTPQIVPRDQDIGVLLVEIGRAHV